MTTSQNLNSPKIDRNKIKIPVITFTDAALNELKLIIENDFTLAGKYFRLLISGKGCDGFTYSAGFTDLLEEDFLVKITNANFSDELLVVVDPFAAFYLNDVVVDFVLDVALNNEGFTITNNQQKEFHGKFFNKDSAKLPPMESHEGETHA